MSLRSVLRIPLRIRFLNRLLKTGVSRDWWDSYSHNELNQIEEEPLADKSYLRGFTSGTGTEWNVT
jgi:hypothetical protein